MTTSFEIPACTGVHGPGEMIRCDGRAASISSSVTWSLRTTPQVDARVDLAEPLHQVVGERVVIIDQQNHEETAWHRQRPQGSANLDRLTFWIVTSTTRPEESQSRMSHSGAAACYLSRCEVRHGGQAYEETAISRPA